jgi:iron complex outermembrane receptor protein
MASFTSFAEGQVAPWEADETMTVTAKKPEEKAWIGTLGDRSILVTPFSIHTYGSQLMADEQHVSANQVLRHDPALTNVATPGGFTGFNLSFRGFPSGADAITFYGMGPGAMFSGSLGQLYSVERLDVIKGPSAGLGAFSPSASVGGSVNIVPKLPEEQDAGVVSLGLRERGIISAHLDVNRRLSEALSVRVNLASESGTTFYKGRDERDVFALALRQKLGNNAIWILGYDQMRIRSEGYQNGFVLAPGVPVPQAPNPSQNHFQKWTWLEQEWNYGYSSLQWNFAGDGKLFIQGLYGIRRRPILSSGTGLIRSEDGDMLLRPNYFAKGTRYKPFYGGNIFLSKSLATGTLRHHLMLSRLQNGFTFITAEGARLDPIPSHLYHPLYVERPILETVGIGRSSEVDAITHALSDDIQLMPGMNLLVGVKSSVLRADSFDVENGEKTLHRKDDGHTPFGAFSYHFHQQSMAYVSYAEGLERGGVAPASAANADEIMKPLNNHQVEFGIKSATWSGLFLSAALFQIERGLEYLDAASNVYLQTGMQRNRGLEFHMNGAFSDRIRAQGGLLLLDPRIVRSENAKNRKAPGAPNITVPLTLSYQWTDALSLNASIQHFGKQAVDAENTRELPSWTRVDAGFRYAFLFTERRMSLQTRVENIGNQRYWASAAGGQLTLGSPEIWKLALRMDL